jgi:hypothetical protein
MQQGHRRTVVLDRATSEQVALLREELSHGSIKPTESQIIREALARGLPLMRGDGRPTEARRRSA